jgi:TolB-like protein/Flp pilus assembly protein TadD
MPRSHDLHPGDHLGSYEIVSRLGSGGMGEVWRARDPRLGREVALKVLPVALSNDPEHLARFEREVRTLAALTHPNIVTIHSVEDAAGVRFLTMELIEGETLDRQIPSVGMAIERFLEIAIVLADTLAAAHARGILHRDLKPGNLMVTREGRVKVLDFGLARRTEAAGVHSSNDPTATLEQLTEDGRILGTVAYMSPEQAQGRPVDVRSDLFSLGTVLYEMATGTRPFRGATTLDVLSSVLRDEPASATDLRPDLPPGLSRILRRCLTKDPERRVQSAKDVRNDLEDLREELAAPAAGPPSKQPAPVARPGRRWRWLTVVAVLALLGIAGALLLDRRGDDRYVAGAAPGAALALLPFQGLGLQDADEYLPNALAEDIHQALAQIAALRVISLPTSMRYRGTDKPLRVIGGELNVAHVLDGSVRPLGDEVRVSLRLIDVLTDQTRWAKSYDIPSDSIFRSQGDVVRNVASAMGITLTPQEVDRVEVPPTANPAAYRAFNMARQRWRDDHAVEEVAGLYRMALKHDPEFALAHAELAFAYYRHGDREAEELAWETVQQALSLDPTLAFGHFMRGTVLMRRGQLNDARAAFHQSMAYDPNSPFAMFNLSVVEYQAGRFDVSLDWARQGLDLSPDEANSFHHVALPLLALGYDEVTERFLRIGLDKETFIGPWGPFGPKPFPRVPLNLSRLALLRGDHQEALDWVRSALELRPDDDELLRQHAIVLTFPDTGDAGEIVDRLHQEGHAPASRFALILMRRGERERAQSLLRQELDAELGRFTDGTENPQSAVGIAGLHALLGNVQEALDWRGYGMGYRHARWLERDPVFDAVRTEERFVSLFEKMHADVTRMRTRVDLSGLPGFEP